MHAACGAGRRPAIGRGRSRCRPTASIGVGGRRGGVRSRGRWWARRASPRTSCEGAERARGEIRRDAHLPVRHHRGGVVDQVEVVRVAQIPRCAQDLLHEAVKAVEMDVGIEGANSVTAPERTTPRYSIRPQNVSPHPPENGRRLVKPACREVSLPVRKFRGARPLRFRAGRPALP